MWKPQGIYTDFILYQPSLLFGDRALNGLATYPGSRFAVIHGSSMQGELREKMELALKKKSVRFIRRSWKGEPDIDGLGKTIEELEEYQPDVIIAVGGGAVIDGAKMCRLFYEYPGFSISSMNTGMLELKTAFIAVPTTIGSGAEASSAAVYVNGEKKRKEMIVSHDLQPSVVVLDPDFVRDTPAFLLASSSIDAMAHIIEGYASNRNNELVDIMGIQALGIFRKELSGKSMNDMDFLSLQYAGYMGGIVQNHCIVGAAHAVAHQMTGYGFSHGEAVALLLPAVIKVNNSDTGTRARYERLCRETGFGSVDELIVFLKRVSEKGNIISRREEIRETLKKNMGNPGFVDNIIADQGGKGNPVCINKDFLMKMIGEI